MAEEEDGTANLHDDDKPKTAREFAKRLGISERQFYKFSSIYRFRPDLADKVAKKEMTVHAAFREMRGEAKPTSRDRLVSAWFNATYEDRQWFQKEVAHWEEEAPAICLPDKSGGAANLQSEGE